MIKKPWSWVVVTSRLMFVDRRDGKRLFLTIVKSVDNEWVVVSAEAHQVDETMEDFFKDHAHKTVGGYPTLRKARTSAISFATMWLKNAKVSRAEKCDCDTIKVPRPKRVRRMVKGRPFVMRVPK